MISFETRNTLAKIAIVCWILSLIAGAFFIVKCAVVFDINEFFALPVDKHFPIEVVQEAKVLVLMLAVSIIGGTSFMIKDFYRSVKYANLYDRAYADYRSSIITQEWFQRIVTFNIYAGRFNYTWIYWFLIQPVLSSALGLIAFFIARSGLWVLQGASADSEITIRSLYLYAVLTFLAGFSSHRFIAWLDRLADKIFSSTIPEVRKAEMRSGVETAAEIDRNALKEEVISNTHLQSTSGKKKGATNLTVSLKQEDSLETSEVDVTGKDEEPEHTLPKVKKGNSAILKNIR